MKLFICYTVSQLFISLHIVKEENIKPEQCEFVIFFGPTSNRNIYYIEELKKVTNLIVVINNYSFMNADRAPKKSAQNVINKLSLNTYQTIYLSSIDRTDLCYILQNITFSNITTFDDGSGNINPHSIFHSYKEPSRFRRLKKSIISGRKLFQIDIIKLSSLHYTIFETQKSDIFKKYKYLNVFSYENINKSNPTNHINIFLGTVYKEVVISQDKASSLITKIQKFIQEKNINIYIPHPRDEVDYVTPYCSYVSPDKLIEEFAADYLNSGYTINIYGIASTALLNLCQVKNVQVFNITSDLLSISCNEFYKLNSLIKPIELDNE